MSFNTRLAEHVKFVSLKHFCSQREVGGTPKVCSVSFCPARPSPIQEKVLLFFERGALMWNVPQFSPLYFRSLPWAQRPGQRGHCFPQFE